MQLPATLTLPTARQTAQALAQAVAALPPGGTLRVDASALADLDTSALAVLLEGRRQAQARSLGWQLDDAPPKLRQLAELYGVQDLLLTPP